MAATAAYSAWNVKQWLCRDRRLLLSDTPKAFPVRVAFICEQMTYDTFSPLCRSAYLTPYNWKKTLRQFRPQLLFCEAAWQGIEEFPHCWRGRIYRNQKVLFENRRVLFSILKACRRRGIPTVFWNKEETLSSPDRRFDFFDTALHFDHILTTAAESVEHYQKAGAASVSVFPFSFSPERYNPLRTDAGEMEWRAVFAGSWYSSQPERCSDMRAMLDQMRACGIPCTIYDRQCGSESDEHRYPPQYHDMIRPGVAYRDLPGVTARCRIALNINTVKDSETMFARRVYEMMAQNHIVISNGSVGMKRQFPGRVGFLDEPFDLEQLDAARRENLIEVFLHHTSRARFAWLLDKLGLFTMEPPVIGFVFDGGAVPLLLEKIDYQPKRILRAGAEGRLTDEEDNEYALSDCDYYVWVREPEQLAGVDWEFLLTQFSFLPKGCGIRCAAPKREENRYRIETDTKNRDCVFDAGAFAGILKEPRKQAMKYIY